MFAQAHAAIVPRTVPHPSAVELATQQSSQRVDTTYPSVTSVLKSSPGRTDVPFSIDPTTALSVSEIPTTVHGGELEPASHTALKRTNVSSILSLSAPNLAISHTAGPPPAGVLVPKNRFVHDFLEIVISNLYCNDPSNEASKIYYFRTDPVIPYLEPEDNLESALPFKFPMSSDHYFITLVQYNVLRAILSNLSYCSLLHILPAECRAALLIPLLPKPSSLPPTFQPTTIQRTIPHKPWLDSIPCPQLRDNMICAEVDGNLNEDDLCEDICGGLYEGYDYTRQKGMLVWGEPWQISSWEITEGFAEKWKWLLRGCTNMMQSTNRWRQSRGEEDLTIDIG
jgi:hypothetical protein